MAMFAKSPLNVNRKRWLAGALVAMAVATVSNAVAAEFNTVLNIGDQAPDFKELPGIDGKNHSLADFKQMPLVAVVFTCNTCPVAADYDDRLIDLARRWPDKVALVAIDSNRGPEESIEALKKRVATKSPPLPYLRDESQSVGRTYGASATPQCFLLSPQRKVLYMGAIDDNSNVRLVKEKHLEAAIEAALVGSTPKLTETFAHGCAIRYARQRK